MQKLSKIAGLLYSCFGIQIISAALILFCMPKDTFSQGFDWQYSGRMPYSAPDKFIGVRAGYSRLFHFGDFNLKEDMIDCCSFQDGQGGRTAFGVTGEYWINGYTALNASLNFSSNSGLFTIRTVLPTREGEFVTEYGFDSKITYISADLGIKRRLWDSRLHVGGALDLAILISGKSVYTEQAVSDNVPFEKREIAGGTIKELSNLLITPSVFAGYDAPLGIGYYASPYIALGYNLNSVISGDSWRKLSVGFGIKILRNL